MNLQIYLSEDNQKLTLCDAEGKCEVFGKVEVDSFTIQKQKKKQKWLSDELKKEIAHRYMKMHDSLETATDIAKDYDIASVTVARIGRTHGGLPVRVMKKILKLSYEPFMTSQDIADTVGVDLRTVNRIIARHRALPFK